jgi:hypothetical protein
VAWDAMKVASAAARARRRQVAARVHFMLNMTILHEHKARARMHIYIYEGTHTSINVQDKLAALSLTPTSLVKQGTRVRRREHGCWPFRPV